MFIVKKHVLVNHWLYYSDRKGRIYISFNFFICVKLIPCGWFCYCWTGVGALYVRKRPRVRLEPIINGGGQERGLRSGTVPSPLGVGLGAACSICKQEMDVRISVSQNYFIYFRMWCSLNDCKLDRLPILSVYHISLI